MEMDCPSCRKPFDMVSRRAKTLPCGHTYCKSCLKKIVDAPDEPPPQLPEDALLQVFGWLPWEELLRGPRAVCRSWRRAALHPLLWGRHQVDAEDQLAAAALRLAPRLLALHLLPEFSNKYTRTLLSGIPAEVIVAACHTGAAVTNLSMDVDCAKSVRLPEALRILQRQVAFGRLRKLQMSVSRGDADAVIRVVYNAGLTELDLAICGEGQALRGGSHWLGRSGGPSLRRVKYDSKEKDSWILTLLAARSDTLEAVEFLNVREPGVMEQLSKCSKLRELSFCDVKDMPSLISFFQGATGLTKLSFRQKTYYDPEVMDLLVALASSGRSQLVELLLSMRSPPPGLPEVLAGLPLLHTLHLRDVPPDEDLDGITPVGAPSLRLLRFYSITLSHCDDSDAGGCCFPALYRLVRRMPRLHVTGLRARHVCHEQQDACVCCLKGLHPIGVEPEERIPHCGLYGHKPEEKCDVELHAGHSFACTLRDVHSLWEDCFCSSDWIYVGPETSRVDNGVA